jgi:hypothetical protein
MNESALSYLLPIIATCVSVGVICLGLAGYHQWREWPHPAAWQSTYGTIRRRK